MSDRGTPPPPPQPRTARTPHSSTQTTTVFLHRLQSHAPTSSQLLGFLTLVISGSILLFLVGLTVTATVLGLIFFTPLIIISSPIWVPVAIVIFLVSVGFLFVCGFGVVSVAALSWMYRYFRGMNPPGSDQVDYARTRIYDTASHVKDYARGYGGYLQSKVKDAAPGA
ncbi:oleosin 1 [Carica papaya]|uniref:oleosin 1 n=1 Tax=Carica papaya TaxID=3649 RepID=UPI000B8CABEC|nr:oleosin 1 [Carica papaya]